MSIEKLIEGLPKRSKTERDQMRANAESKLATGTAKQQSDAQTLLAELDAIEARDQEAFIGELKGLEVPERVVRAFTDVPMTETDAKVLKALLDNPGANSEELSAAIGWRGQSWHMHFGSMCARRATFLWPAPYSEKRDADFYSGILADHSWETGRLTYSMKSDVSAALASMGVRASRTAG